MTNLLHFAAMYYRFDMLNLYIQCGADVNSTGNYGYTALHWAASRKHGKIANLLIQKGAKYDIKDMDGRTPMDLWPELKSLLNPDFPFTVGQKCPKVRLN